MLSKLLTMTAMGALCALSTPTYAVSTTQPGETVGFAVGAPLPPDIYLGNTFDWGKRVNRERPSRWDSGFDLVHAVADRCVSACSS